MIENVQVRIESYGMTQRLKDMAAITTPDAQTIVVQPFDKAVMDDIRKAIMAANLGINPVPGQLHALPGPVPLRRTPPRARQARHPDGRRRQGPRP
jgi:ribosome recycling factor